MADSRRINSNICEEEEEEEEPRQEGAEPRPPPWLSAIILSSEFWPQLKEEKMEMPAVVRRATDDYTRRYEKLKVTHARLSR